MKFKNRVFIVFSLTGMILYSLHSNTQQIQSDLQMHKRSIEEDAFSVINYLSLFGDAHEEYSQSNTLEPQIKCTKCNTKTLDLAEFWGGLVGWALKDVVDGKENFTKAQVILDGCLRVICAGICPDIIDYMVRASNETMQACSHCQERSSSWAYID